MRSTWSDRLFGRKGKNKQPDSGMHAAAVKPIETAPQPPETHEFVQQIHGSLSISQYHHFPAFSDNQTANFIRKYQSSTHEVNSLPIVSGDLCDNLPITPETTCEDVFNALSSRYPASHFVVQLGDLLFQFDETSCDKRRWLDAINSHSCTIVVCQSNANTLQDQSLAALHKTGFANTFISNDEIIKHAKSYHVIFLNSPDDHSAQSIVRTFSPDAQVNDEGWLHGTVPNLDGATFWAPSSSESDTPDGWIALTRTLSGPVRVMVCVSMESSRFIVDSNRAFFEKVSRAFWLPATGSVDIIFTDGPYTYSHAANDIKAYAYSSAAAVCEWLPAVQCAYSWTRTKHDYERLNAAGREMANTGTNRMLASLRAYHGVPLNLVIHDTKAQMNHRLVCNSLNEENLKSLAEVISRTLDTELMLRAVKILHGDHTVPQEEKLKAELKKLIDYLNKVPLNWFFKVDRTFLENAVHMFRMTHPSNAAQAAASTAPRPRRML